MNERLKQKLEEMKADLCALYFASKHPKTPWHAKMFIALVVGYALSPIDLIPDFIPVLGYVDDFILVPLGIVFAIKMIPREIMDECRLKAKTTLPHKGKHWIAGACILVIWFVSIGWAVSFLIRYFK